MKKLMMVALIAGSMVAVGADAPAAAPVPAANEATAAAPVKLNRLMRPQRTPKTEEQRAQMRVQREKFMNERRAAMQADAVEIIKKYGLDDEKAKALYMELQAKMRSSRRNMMMGGANRMNRLGRGPAKPVVPNVAPQAPAANVTPATAPVAK